MEESTPFAAILLSPLVFATNYFAWLYRPFAKLLQRLPRPRKGVFASALNAAAQDPEAIRSVLEAHEQWTFWEMLAGHSCGQMAVFWVYLMFQRSVGMPLSTLSPNRVATPAG